MLQVDCLSLLSAVVGSSERSVRNLFLKAREASPCIVVCDHIEAIGKKRGDDSSTHKSADRLLSCLLTEMDGVTAEKISTNTMERKRDECREGGGGNKEAEEEDEKRQIIEMVDEAMWEEFYGLPSNTEEDVECHESEKSMCGREKRTSNEEEGKKERVKKKSRHLGVEEKRIAILGITSTPGA